MPLPRESRLPNRCGPPLLCESRLPNRWGAPLFGEAPVRNRWGAPLFGEAPVRNRCGARLLRQARRPNRCGPPPLREARVPWPRAAPPMRDSALGSSRRDATKRGARRSKETPPAGKTRSLVSRRMCVVALQPPSGPPAPRAPRGDLRGAVSHRQVHRIFDNEPSGENARSSTHVFPPSLRIPNISLATWRLGGSHFELPPSEGRAHNGAPNGMLPFQSPR
jgi:hypothetical protein